MPLGADEPDPPESVDALTEALAAELRRLRANSGRSLRELQEVTFSSDSALSRYLSGKALPPWSVVEGLCRVGGGNPEAMRPLWEHARRFRSVGRSSGAPRVRSAVAASAETPEPPAQDTAPTTLASHVLDIRRAISQSEKRIKRSLTRVAIILCVVVQFSVASSGPSPQSARAARGHSTGPAPGSASPSGPGGGAAGGAAREVRELFADESGWHSRGTGLPATAVSAVHLGGAHPEILAIHDGKLRRYHNNDGAGWNAEDTGIAAVAVSAASTGGARPHIVTIGANGTLHQVVHDDRWRAIDTGIRVRAISAVYAGQHPQVMAIDDRDYLIQLYADRDAWKVDRIDVRVKGIAAVYMRGQWPQVMATDDGGRLLHIYGDTGGWHVGDTGLRLGSNTVIAAVNTGAHWPAVMATDADGRLLHIYGDATGWHAADTGVRASTVAAVDMGGSRPYTIRAY